MKYRVNYLDKPSDQAIIIEAAKVRAAAQQFFSQNPRKERCRIRVVQIEGLPRKSEWDFDAVQFMDESTRASLPSPPAPPAPPREEIVVKTYRGTETEATAAFRRDASFMARQGYFPISQSWTSGQYGAGAFLGALILCLACVGIIIFIYMLIVKPSGSLTVTYQLRLSQPPPQPPLPSVSSP